MIDEILPDRVVTIRREGDFQFGAHAVHAGDKHGLLHAAEIGSKQAAEPANLAEHLGAVRLAHEFLDSAFDLVAEVHIDAGGGVGFFAHERVVSEKRQFERPGAAGALCRGDFHDVFVERLVVGQRVVASKQAMQKFFFGRPVARTMESTSR